MNFLNDELGVVRLGDKTTHGGQVIKVASITTVDGISIARKDDLTVCPRCKGTYAIVEGAPDYFDENIPVALDGHKTACGAGLISSLK